MLTNSSDNFVHHYNVQILNVFYPEIQLSNTKSVIKNKLLSELKKFKVQTVLILDYEKINVHKIFHSSAKLIAIDLDIAEAFKSMLQSITTK